jgi:wyosine [tRNA(Phe)-imidazoG37] synthetase (radical SAM superfamily)
MEKRRNIFGPVPSRRFGRSLGVDLTPFKTCSLDCVFCQLGRTTNKTINRQEYVPTQAVIQEIDEWIKTGEEADYITLSGSGEPTLHSHFGEVLRFIPDKSTTPAVLLTNGTLLYLPEVRDAASHADIVKVSLSAWDQVSYGRINRPHPQLKFHQLVEGQNAFRRQFRGELWMEVFLVEGMNSTPSEVSRIASLAGEIKPDRIQLNTAVRPPAEGFAEPVSMDRMLSLCHLFDPNAEVIAEFKLEKDSKMQINKETILSMLRRRPCTASQIASGFGMHINEVAKYLGNLISSGQIREERRNNTLYYAAARRKDKVVSKQGSRKQGH